MDQFTRIATIDAPLLSWGYNPEVVHPRLNVAVKTKNIVREFSPIQWHVKSKQQTYTRLNVQNSPPHMPCNMCWPLKRFLLKKNMAPTKSYLMICLPLILDLPISRSPTSILKPPSNSPRQPKPSPIGPQAAPYGTQRYRHVRLPSCTGRKMMANWQIVLQGWHAPPLFKQKYLKAISSFDLLFVAWLQCTATESSHWDEIAVFLRCKLSQQLFAAPEIWPVFLRNLFTFARRLRFSNRYWLPVGWTG